MDSLSTESERLLASLRSKITNVMKESSVVSVFEDGVLQPVRLQKARMRVRVQLNACLTACPKEQREGEIGNRPGAVTEDEITRAALTISFAMLNPDYVAWDVERYADMAKNGVQSKQREKLRKYFPTSPLGKISEPTTIVDNHGKILVWYLPDILSPERVNFINVATKGLRGLLLRSIPAVSDNKKQTWRSDNFFERDGEFGAGRLTISPAYFMLGHERLQDPLVTSASYSAKEVQDWLDVMSSVEFFWNAVTGAIAPDLFHAGSAAIAEVRGKTRAFTNSVPVSRWPSIFSALEVIVNRVTLPHRDAGGTQSHYDMLVSLGIGHDAIFSIKDLEADLDYFPGTICFICGKVLEHSVGPWQKGERFVLAHFIKDKVHDRLGVARPLFPVQGDFLHLVGSKDYRPVAERRRGNDKQCGRNNDGLNRNYPQPTTLNPTHPLTTMSSPRQNQSSSDHENYKARTAELQRRKAEQAAALKRQQEQERELAQAERQMEEERQRKKEERARKRKEEEERKEAEEERTPKEEEKKRVEEDARKNAERRAKRLADARQLAEARKKVELRSKARQLAEIDETMSVEIVEDDGEGSTGESLILESAGGPVMGHTIYKLPAAVKAPAAVEIPGKKCHGCIDHQTVCKWEGDAKSKTTCLACRKRKKKCFLEGKKKRERADTGNSPRGGKNKKTKSARRIADSSEYEEVPQAGGSRPRRRCQGSPGEGSPGEGSPEEVTPYGEEARIVEVDDVAWVAAANNMVIAIEDMREELNAVRGAVQIDTERQVRYALKQREQHRENVLLLSTLIRTMGGDVPVEIAQRRVAGLERDVRGAEASEEHGKGKEREQDEEAGVEDEEEMGSDEESEETEDSDE